MVEQKKTKISGTGTIGAGTYGDISISGSGKISGDIVCGDLKISGSCRSVGNIEAHLVSSSGAFKCDGNINAHEIKVSGSGKCEGNVKVKRMSVSGSFKSEDKYLNAESINVSGALKNELEINVGVLDVSGKIDAKEIVGTSVNILKNEIFTFSTGLFFSGLRRLNLNKAETITCETLFARNLKCTKVCAENITLKNNSIVDYVECNGILRIDCSSSVKKIEGNCEIIHE